MQTKKIEIDQKNTRVAQIMEVTEQFAQYLELEKKQRFYLNILVEESLGMIGMIAESFKGEFWIEGEKGENSEIHLQFRTYLDAEKRKELLKVATQESEKSTGFMNRLRGVIESCLYAALEDEEEETQTVSRPSAAYVPRGVVLPTAISSGCVWSMEEYRKGMEKAENTDKTAKESWDELEKSIVANIADDIRVSMKGATVEMVIKKRF